MKRLASIIMLLALCAVARGQGGAISFIATNSAVSYADSPEFDLAGDFTLTAWVYLRSMVHCSTIMATTQNNPFRGWMWWFSSVSNAIVFSTYGGSNVYSSTGKITTNMWHHFAVVATATTLSHYIDGVLSGSDSRPTITGTSSALGVGGYGGFGDYWGNSVNGIMFDVRIFTRALNANEILEYINYSWLHVADSAQVFRVCVVTNDTDSALVGVAPNLGTGSDGTYISTLAAAQPHVQTEKPLTMELP